MKKKLCRFIFKKELENEHIMINNSYRHELLRLENAMRQKEEKYAIVKSVFEFFQDAEIIGIEENKNGEELIVVLHNDTIYLLGERYKVFGDSPYINFRVLSKVSGLLEEKYIHIQDVIMKDNNIGNGTVAMKALIKYAKKINAKYIDGELSGFDDDHAERRNHFYEKFGFMIKNSTIHLELK